MKHHVIKFLAFAFCLVSLLPSCSKSPENIGVDFQSQDDYIDLQFTDTISLIAYSTLSDSIGTTNVSPMLGSILDPIFGITNAGFYTQLHVSTTTPPFDSAVIDSVVFNLAISGYYGDTMTPQTVSVYELQDSLTLENDNRYYSTSIVNCKPTDLANAYQYMAHPLTKDTSNVAQLRVPVDGIAERLKTIEANSSNDKLREVIYGLCLAPTQVTSGGNILNFTLTDNSKTYMRVYYHYEQENKAQTYDFYVTSSDVFFNSFSHDYSYGSSDFKQQVIDGDTTLGAQQLFVQPTGGVKTFVKFPDIEKLKADDGHHIVINEARLIMTGEVTDTTTYKSPSALALVMIDDDGSTLTLPDVSEGTSYYSGTYNSAKNIVMFRITEYLQGLLNGKYSNNGLWMTVSGAGYTPNRWVMGGTNAGENRIRLELKYSTVQE